MNNLPEGYTWLNSLDQFVDEICKYVDVYKPETSEPIQKLAVDEQLVKDAMTQSKAAGGGQ